MTTGRINQVAGCVTACHRVWLELFKAIDARRTRTNLVATIFMVGRSCERGLEQCSA